MKQYLNLVEGIAMVSGLMVLVGLICCCLSTNPSQRGSLRAGNASCSCDGGYAGVWSLWKFLFDTLLAPSLLSSYSSLNLNMIYIELLVAWYSSISCNQLILDTVMFSLMEVWPYLILCDRMVNFGVRIYNYWCHYVEIRRVLHLHPTRSSAFPVFVIGA